MISVLTQASLGCSSGFSQLLTKINSHRCLLHFPIGISLLRQALAMRPTVHLRHSIHIPSGDIREIRKHLPAAANPQSCSRPPAIRRKLAAKAPAPNTSLQLDWVPVTAFLVAPWPPVPLRRL